VATFVELGHVLERNPQRLEARHVATCLHAPFHRFEDGDDLSRIPLGAVAGIPGMVVDAAASPVRSHSGSTRRRSGTGRSSSGRAGTNAGGPGDIGSPGRTFTLRYSISSWAAVPPSSASISGTSTTPPTSRGRLGLGSFEPECSSSSTSATSAVFPARGSDSSPSRSASPAGLPSPYGRSPSSRRGTALTGRPAPEQGRGDRHAP